MRSYISDIFAHLLNCGCNFFAFPFETINFQGHISIRKCRRPLFPVSSKLEFLIFRAMVFQGFYPLNGSLQFLRYFRSPFVDKAFGRQPGIGNAVRHISRVSDICLMKFIRVVIDSPFFTHYPDFP